MTRNKHFYDQVHMLGVTGNIYPHRDQSVSQILAELRWANIDKKAGQIISERGAKDLVGETLHHPAMDEIHGIDDVRGSFNPETDVRVSNDLPSNRLGQVESGMWGKQTMKLANRPDMPLQTSTVTHEVSHLLAHPTLSDFQYAYPKHANSIGHNWAMARAHVHAVRAALGDEAAENLRSIYRAYGVGFGRRVI